MFDKSGAYRFKKPTPVAVSLAGAAPFDAAVFLHVEERLIDLLNDQRAFIPARRADGSMMFLAKTSIVSIVEKAVEPEPDRTEKPAEDAETPRQEEAPKSERKERPDAARRFRRAYDPYEILRIAADASIEEIRKAYKARIKAVHPDTIAALDLDDDIERAAILAAQKVNHAYQKILKDRKATKADAD
ncbi:MAG: J domain-containing protein, partial [Amphiplicatus sp.]